MKKLFRVKRVLLLLALVSVLFATVCVFAFANERVVGLTIDVENDADATKTYPDGSYVVKKLPKIPNTLEAWVYIPKSVHSSRCGVIFGNYMAFQNDDFINFEIHQSGLPRLVMSNLDGTLKDYMFRKCMIKPDVWTHVAIVYGTGTDGKQIECYINGVRKEASAVNKWYEANPETLDNQICLGGDVRPLNTQSFLGTLGSVWVYSDVRTAAEIQSDYEKGPDKNDSELLVCYEIDSSCQGKDIPDASGNGYDMMYTKMWMTEEEMQAVRDADPHEYTYSIAFLPDIQYSTQKYPENLVPIYDYLIESTEKRNLQYVIGLGDITHRNTEEEWANIKPQVERLNGILPYSLVRGNHDVTYNNYAELFDFTFGKGNYYYDHVANTGGFMNKNSVKNTYLLFSVGEVDYIIINLDFGATDDILKWAGEILEQYPDHRAIIVTHGYMNIDATTLDPNDSATPSAYKKTWNDGDDMWEKLISQHENVDIAVSGHILQDDICVGPDQGVHGNTVYQMLIDPQSVDNTLKGAGFVAMMYFTEDGNHARIEMYSTVFKKYYRESSTRLSFEFGEPEPETQPPETTTAAPETTLAPETTPAPDTTAEQPVTNEGGCGSGIVAIIPVAVAVAGAVVLKKKRRI